MRSACAISTCVVPSNNPTTRRAISIPSYHRFSSPTDRSLCRGESESDGRCSRRVVPTQTQRFKGVVQPSGNAGGYWVDFLLRGDPPCLNQCSPKKRALTLQPSSATVPDLSQTRERIRRRHDCQSQT